MGRQDEVISWGAGQTVHKGMKYPAVEPEATAHQGRGEAGSAEPEGDVTTKVLLGNLSEVPHGGAAEEGGIQGVRRCPVRRQRIDPSAFLCVLTTIDRRF